MEKHGKIRYRFMNAYLFATVFQKNQEALKDLIAALLRIELKEIVSLEILNPILPGQDIDHKSCIMDILVLLNGNIRVNLEMQVLDEGNWNERGVYYLAENLLDLKKGEDYKNLKTTVQIGILDFDLWKSGKNPFYQVYELWDTEHDRVFTNKMKLCVLSLRQAEKAEERERQSGLYDWAKTLTAETWEELQGLSEKNEKIKEITTMEKLIEILEDIQLDADYETCTTLIDDGILDSFAILSIVGELEDEFDVSVTPADIIPENFNSAQALWAMVQRLQAE